MVLEKLKLDREAKEPLHEQLREAVARAIGEGVVRAGERLPSTREAAEALGVSRATAVEAYRQLEADALVERRRGSGTYVLPPSSGRIHAGLSGRRRPATTTRAAAQQDARPALPPGTLDLAGLVPHERNYPADEFADCLRRVMDARGGAALGYGPAAGDPTLREVLAERLSRRRGLPVDPSGILLVGGAQQGLDVVFRTWLHAGDVVVTESPTYHLALELLHFHGARIEGVPLRRAARGASTFDADALEDAFARTRPTLAYAMPSFQNPTGLSLDAPSRRRLASACRDAGVLLVEDDYEGEMRHEGPDVAPIAALPEAGEVAYVGTLSKALFPGLRVGWVVAPPDLLARLAQVKRLSDLSGSVLLQAVAAELIVSGAYDRHLESAVASARERMRLMVAALETRLPEGCRVTAPQGGHVLWLEAPAPSGHAIVERALAEGVAVTAGETFLPGEPDVAAVRVSIARVEASEIEEAASRLARAVAALVQEGRRRPEAGMDMERAVQV